jgi:hypothetical protein
MELLANETLTNRKKHLKILFVSFNGVYAFNCS